MSNCKTDAKKGLRLEKVRMIGYDSAMADKGFKKKKHQKRTKNGLPVFHSDREFLREFEKAHHLSCAPLVTESKKTLKNRHGVEIIDLQNESAAVTHSRETDNFAQLLEDYLKTRPLSPLKKSDPVPVKKRLKRYPDVQVELDLHGFTAAIAQIRASSFLHSCKIQGLFTVRIIVGKGIHSDHGPILPDVVEDVVLQMKHRDIVLWYEWEHKKKSRSGALIVYLKQFDQYD